MQKKKVVKTRPEKNYPKSDFEKRVDNIDNAIENLEDDLDKDVEIIENWMIQRKKFFIKLSLVLIFVLILFLISLLLSK